MFTFSVKLEKWSFHVADLPRTRKKCTELKKAREGRAKLLFLSIKYAKKGRRRCSRVVDLKLSNNSCCAAEIAWVLVINRVKNIIHLVFTLLCIYSS